MSNSTVPSPHTKDIVGAGDCGNDDISVHSNQSTPGRLRTVSNAYKQANEFVKDNHEIFNIVDPTVRQQQSEWEDLLLISGKGEEIPFVRQEIFGEVTRKHMTAAVWVQDAIHARAIQYPRTDNELDKLKVVRSAWLRSVFNIAAVYQIIAPFLNRPICLEVGSSGSGWDWFQHGGAPTITALAAFDIISLSIFSYDLYLKLSINQSQKSIITNPWSVFRLLTSVFLLGAIISTFCGNYSAQLYLRCLFPFLMVSRRNNLKLMMQGLMHSMYYTFHVIVALTCLIMMWGLVGFFLFRGIAEKGSRFNSVSSAIFTSLHCYTTRPYSLLALNDLFDTEGLSAMWFVTLTLSADILCTAFIIAVGTRQYREFAAKILIKRLLDRKKATFSVFEGFATVDGFALKDWKLICANISDSRYALNEAAAEHIFAMEDTERVGFLDIDGFVRCLGSVAARIQFRKGSTVVGAENVNANGTAVDPLTDKEGESPDNLSDGEKVEMKSTGSSITGSNTADADEVMNAIHAEGGTSQSNAGKTAAVGRENGSVSTFIQVESKKTKENQHNDFNPTPQVQKVTEVVINTIPEDAVLAPGSADKEKDGANSDDDQFPTDGLHGIADTFNVRAQGALPTNEDAVLRIQHMFPSTDQAGYVDNVAELVEWRKQSKIDKVLGTCFGDCITNLLIVCNTMIDFEIVIRFSTQSAFVMISEYFGGADDKEMKTKAKFVRYHVPVYDSIFMFALHICLIFQLAHVSNPFALRNWHVFGWVLEAFFLLDMLMKYAVFGYRGLGKSKLSRLCETCINLSSFVAILVVASDRAGVYGEAYIQDPSNPSPALSVMIIIQSLRFFKLFFLINDQDIFEDIYPTVFRALFILFSVIYFFAVFAHSFFCSDMVASAAVLNADDDASDWVPFASLLNFDSFSQSLFTMFELSTYSNWSVVMDAAEKQAGLRAYFFFYIYRLVMTLFVIPLLVSFIMNSFVSAVVKKDKRWQSKKDEEDHANVALGMTMDFSADTTIRAEKGALEAYANNSDLNSIPKNEYEVHGDKQRSRTATLSVGYAPDLTDIRRPNLQARKSHTDTISSFFSNIRKALPTLSLNTSKGRGDGADRDYVISSRKVSTSEAPSMLAIWSQTTNPTRHAAKQADSERRSTIGNDDGSRPGSFAGSFAGGAHDASRASFTPRDSMSNNASRPSNTQALTQSVALANDIYTDEILATNASPANSAAIQQLQNKVAQLEAALLQEKAKSQVENHGSTK